MKESICCKLEIIFKISQINIDSGIVTYYECLSLLSKRSHECDSEISKKAYNSVARALHSDAHFILPSFIAPSAAMLYNTVASSILF